MGKFAYEYTSLDAVDNRITDLLVKLCWESVLESTPGDR